ncbi:hypothetical protein OC834_006381 [Tilletia horrida]|nr:hypothetical protein OC834_006381 [Tilletia horrida]
MSSPVQIPQVHDVLADTNKPQSGSRLGDLLAQVVQLRLQQHKLQSESNIELVHGLRTVPTTTSSSIGKNSGAVEPAQGTTAPLIPTPLAQQLLRVDAEQAKMLLSEMPAIDLSTVQAAVYQRPDLPYAAVAVAVDMHGVALPTQSHINVNKTDSNESGDGGAGMKRKASNQLAPQGQFSSTGSGSTHADADVDLDLWIVQNELYARARSVLDDAANQKAVQSAKQKAADAGVKLVLDTDASHWDQYMVGLARDGPRAFSPTLTSGGSAPTSVSELNTNQMLCRADTFTFPRPAKDTLPGTSIADQYRQDGGVISLNSFEAYQKRFDHMTAGIFKGFDWRNTLVAGGIALAALVSTTEVDEKAWSGSDVDVFFYGLNADQAMAKTRQIEALLVKHLPELSAAEEKKSKRKYSVVRTAGTISFIPADPRFRRIQIVLKMFLNPMSVVMGFDLDQVAVGYTRDEVWMMPRCARALVTGYTTFTMDLIHGHVLEPRSTTEESRLHKYAKRGFGLRFLPSYLASLPQVAVSEKTTDVRDENEAGLPRDELSVTLREERARVRFWVAHRLHPRGGLELSWHSRVSFGELEDRTLRDDDRNKFLARSSDANALSSWQRFARRLALWEMAQEEEPMIRIYQPKNDYELSPYEEGPLGYDDAPSIAWNHQDGLNKLAEAIEEANETGVNVIRASLSMWSLGTTEDCDHAMKTAVAKQRPVTRTAFGWTLDQALATDLVSIVFLPKTLRDFAKKQLPSSLFDFVDVLKPKFMPVHNGGGGTSVQTRVLDSELGYYVTHVRSPGRADPDFVLSYFVQKAAGSSGGFATQQAKTSGPSTKKVEGSSACANVYWALTERTVDETREVLHALRRAHANATLRESVRNSIMRHHLMRRMPRNSSAEELAAFKKWTLSKVKLYPVDEFKKFVRSTLNVPRWAIFNRFQYTKEQILALKLDRSFPSFSHYAFFHDGPTAETCRLAWFGRNLDGVRAEQAKQRERMNAVLAVLSPEDRAYLMND